MKLGVASVILCAAVFASFCNAIPFPIRFWEEELLMDELDNMQQDLHIGSDVEARIEQDDGSVCPTTNFNFTYASLSRESVYKKQNTEEVLGRDVIFICDAGSKLYTRKNGGDFERATANNAAVNRLTYSCDGSTGNTFQKAIAELGEPRCFPLCPELQQITNGAVSVTSRELRGTASYSCSSTEYVLSGSQTRICGEDGKWSGNRPTCIPLCPELPDIANGAVRYSNRRPGGTATYSCSSSEYVLIGSETRTCTQTSAGKAEWSGQAPRCSPIPQCPELPNIVNGAVSYSNRKPGGTATYSCNSNSEISGSPTRTCTQVSNTKSEWSGQAPRCIPLCPKLPNIANGGVSYSNRRPGGTATYSCGSGEYVLSGSQTRTCTQTSAGRAEWSGQAPRCIPLCPDLPAIQNGAVTYSGRRPGQEATYSCGKDFVLSGSKTRVCGQSEEGKWSGQQPSCEPIVCPLVSPTIPHGSSSASRGPIRGPGGQQGYGIGTTVTYTCGDPDFELQGEGTRTCIQSADGSRGEWNRPAPSCIETKCPQLPLINIPNNVPGAKRQLRNNRNYDELLFKPYYSRRIEGDRSEGSKAYLTCLNDWKLQQGTPAVQTCVRENGALVWSKAGICVYSYSYTKYG